MPNDIQNLKVLLLQIRNQPKVRAEELASFAVYSGLQSEQITVLNVFDTPDFDVSVTDGFDALFVGGASEASVLEPEKYPFVQPSIRLLQHCVEISLPVFASCFGFQLAVLALGGKIIRDQENFEIGTPALSLAEAANNDPLFRDTPDNFQAISVHKERTTNVPENCDLLAYTEACVHSFRVTDKPFWAFQFHPELDRPTLIERLTIYKAQYTDGDGHLDQVLASAADTPESNALVRKFVNRVLLGN
jgi:GMP synthase (glutamine-hydrolysing)